MLHALQSRADLVNAFAALFYAFLTAILVALCALQLREIRNSLSESYKMRSASVLLEVYGIMQALRPHWHRVYLLPKDWSNWTPEEKFTADHVGTTLQQVAFLVTHDLIDAQYIVDGWGKVFVQCWLKLEPFIKTYRVQSNEPAELAEGLIQQRRDLEIFAKRCRETLPTTAWTDHTNL